MYITSKISCNEIGMMTTKPSQVRDQERKDLSTSFEDRPKEGIYKGVDT